MEGRGLTLMPILDFVFEDLALLVTDDGYEAAHVSGIAAIDYGNDGHWRVVSLGVDAEHLVRGESGALHRQMRRFKPEGWVAQKIELALLTDPDWQRRIHDEIAAAKRSREGKPESSSFLRRFKRLLEV